MHTSPAGVTSFCHHVHRSANMPLPNYGGWRWLHSYTPPRQVAASPHSCAPHPAAMYRQAASPQPLACMHRPQLPHASWTTAARSCYDTRAHAATAAPPVIPTHRKVQIIRKIHCSSQEDGFVPLPARLHSAHHQDESATPQPGSNTETCNGPGPP